MRRLDPDDFVPCPVPPPLAADGLHLWLWDDGSAYGAAASVAANRRLRALLAQYLAVAPEALAIERSEFGKPFLVGAGSLRFNLSHSGAFTAVALAHADVGVDVEQPRRQRDVMPLARRYFAAEEAAALDALPEARRRDAFYALWTCKEAVLKAHGRGIAFGLDRLRFALSVDDGMPQRLAGIADEAGPTAHWHTLRFALRDGVGALAWRGEALSIQAFRGVV